MEPDSSLPPAKVTEPQVAKTEDPVESVSDEHTYKFNVKMTCGGCSGAVTRALQKAKDQGTDISSFEVDLATQEVVIKGSISYDDVLGKIKKTGKEVLSGTTVE